MAKQNPHNPTQDETRTGLGLEQFAMGAVKAAETEEASEISRRWLRTVFGLVLFVLVLAAGIWWFTSGRDRLFRPGSEDKQFLLSLKELEAVRAGTISDFRFVGVDALDFQVSPKLSRDNKEDQLTLRQAVVELVAAFSDYREGKVVRVTGRQGRTVVTEGRLLQKSGWSGRSLLEAFRAGELELPVWVSLPGEGHGFTQDRTLE
jgi:hypothetical protein